MTRMLRASARAVLGIVAGLIAVAVLCSSAGANETVLVCDVYGDHVAPLPAGVLGIGATVNCPGNPQGLPPSGGMELYTVGQRSVKQGSDVAFRVDAPAG